jgi:DNA modification methylase
MPVRISKARGQTKSFAPSSAELGRAGDSNSNSDRAQPAAQPPLSRSDAGRVIVHRPVTALTANPRNARTHDDKQVALIAASMRQFGFTNPILIDDNGMVLAGHARLEAAKRLGRATVPTVALDGLSNAEKRAYVLADNRLTEKAGWDLEIVGEELKFLCDFELDFDVSITGFDTVDIDRLVEGLDGAIDPKADEVPPFVSEQPAVSRPGDLWQLGHHRLLCADALDPESYKCLLDGNPAQLVFTDPPYNVPIDGHVGGMGRARHREFVMASGEMSEPEFSGFLTRALFNARESCVDGAILYVCMDWRHAGELQNAAREAGLEQKNLCVWVKDNGGMGAFYRSRHELVFVFKAGQQPHINNFGLGENGRYRTNVWEYAGVNTFRRGRQEELAMHPTVKPVALVADALRDCSHRGGIVLDPFGGSGTTLIAAQKTGRVACLLELDPSYVDVIIRRWEAFSGGRAQHGATGRSFAETAEERAASVAAEASLQSPQEAGHGR